MKKLDEFLLTVYFTNFKTLHSIKTLSHLSINNSLVSITMQKNGDGDGSGSGYGYGNGYGYGSGSGDGSGYGDGYG